MKGAISELDEKKYTYMQKIFTGIHNIQQQYNWLITDCECIPKNEKYEKMFNNKDYYWMTGKELTQIVKDEDFQWIWAVLSGFQKNIPLEEVLKYKLPYADGYKGFWNEEVTIQHQFAEIEIVSWDSSLTLLISRNDEIVLNFRNTFSLSEDLEEYNYF